MNKLIILGLVAFTTTAEGAVLRAIKTDTIANTSGGSAITVPASGSNFVSDTATQTLTNKTISGASNTISNLSASNISSGTLGVSFGGTGANTLTADAVIIGQGTSAVSFVSPGTSGNILTSNGTSWTSAAPAGFSPTINNSAASPQSVTAGGGISISGPAYVNVVYVESNGGSVTVTATPSITQCTQPGQLLYVIGKNATDIITLQDEAGLAGSNLQLNGNYTTGLNSVLTLVCEAASGDWIEVSRQ